jgi:23S rRNA pseudouridine2605 synthase
VSKNKTNTPSNHPFQKFLKGPKEIFEPAPEKKERVRFTKKDNPPKKFETALDKKISSRIKDLAIDKTTPSEEIVAGDDNIRLNKYLAHAGVASRRKADELIAAGKVKVNGKVVLEMGYKVMANDKVTFDNKVINPEKKVYILLNKPKDCITTTNDEKDRRTVLDLIQGAYAQIESVKKPRLYPVGRLDRNTSGVLLITNDGELAQNLTHPSREIKKIYHVFLDKNLTPEDFEKIVHGVVLEDGIAPVDELAFSNPKNKKEIGIQIHNGKNRIVRRIFEYLGYVVEKLDRVYFGGLTKKDLPRGRWRFLDEDEIRLLKHFI